MRGKAAKQIQKISPPDFQRIQQAINALAKTPRPSGAKMLKGDSAFRVRVGNYRILYEIDDSTRTVTIYRVKHRRDVYR